MDTIKDELRQFIARNFLFSTTVTFADDDSFLELGLIDSTGILEVIGMLEETYGITVEETELIPENLDSVSALARFIRTKTEMMHQRAEVH